MEDRELTIKFLTDHRKSLLEKRERLYRPLQEVDQEIEHIDGTLRSLQRPAVTVTGTITIDFPIGKLRKLTQVQALMVIANHYGGTFKAQEAKRLLIRAGVMRETKNSSNIIHAVIVRSEKFEKVRPGEYRLKTAPANNAGGVLLAASKLASGAGDHGLFSPSKPVQ
ncbi:MAG: hypothetical protein WAM04_09740 [Candidatus Sulfotelmatobacter sp.]